MVDMEEKASPIFGMFVSEEDAWIQAFTRYIIHGLMHIDDSYTHAQVDYIDDGVHA